MNDIISSFIKWCKEKTNSPLYFTYIWTFILWNWQFFQIVFFESSDLFTEPRIEYIQEVLYLSLLPGDAWGGAGHLLNFVANIGWHTLPPVLFTFLSIKYLPLLNAWAHNIHLKNYFSRKEVYDKANASYEKKRTRYLEETAEQKTRQKTARVEIQETQTREEKWENEFVDFAKDKENLTALKSANTALYETGGQYTGNPTRADRGYITYIRADLVSRLDTNGLIEIEKGDYDKLMALTEKGKFFFNLARRNSLM